VKHIEYNGKEIMNAKLNDKVYASSGKCARNKAVLSMGTYLFRRVLLPVPKHGARFGNIIGKKVSDPKKYHHLKLLFPVRMQMYTETYGD
jgi:hypothetical protein